ncbi:MAG: hypothetical protein HQK75_15830 [Candidatus Magnetomorum sp.]|nr:hypothetical protein [Candidatus Magnetomorum sp.]
MRRYCYAALMIIMWFQINPFSISAGPPEMPAKITGMLTINGRNLTDSTAIGFNVYVTRLDGTSYSPSAEDTDGLTDNFYSLYIPFSGTVIATQGEQAIIHVSKSGVEATITSPAGGVLTIGESGSNTQINIQADIDLQPGLKIIF